MLNPEERFDITYDLNVLSVMDTWTYFLESQLPRDNSLATLYSTFN